MEEKSDMSLEDTAADIQSFHHTEDCGKYLDIALGYVLPRCPIDLIREFVGGEGFK